MRLASPYFVFLTSAWLLLANVGPEACGFGVNQNSAEEKSCTSQVSSAKPALRPTDQREQMEAILNQPWEADFDAVPLGKVFEWFSEKYGIEFVIDPSYKDDIDLKEPITLQVKPGIMTGKSLLRELLLKPRMLEYHFEKYSLLITSDEAFLFDRYEIEVYGCQDLIAGSAKFNLSDPQQRKRCKRLIHALDILVRQPEMIGENSEHQSSRPSETQHKAGETLGFWESDEGEASPEEYVKAVGGSLIIRCEPDDHALVRRYLRMIRTAQDGDQEVKSLRDQSEIAAEKFVTDGRNRINAILDQPWNIDVHQVPFQKVLEQFGRQHNLEIFIDPRAVADIALEEPLDLQIEPGVFSGRTVLRHFVLGARDASYRIVDHCLFIMTEMDYWFTNHEITFHYCRDLLETPVSCDGIEQQRLQKQAELVDVLYQMIRNPEPYWSDNGGSPELYYEFVKAFNGCLCVRARPDDQERIRNFLHHLRHQKEPENNRIEAILNKPWQAEFQQVPLQEVFDHFSDQYGFKIVIDPRAIQDIDLEEPIGLVVKSNTITGKTVLRDLLLGPRELSYRISKGVLLITTWHQSIEYPLETQVYRCKQLLSTRDKGARGQLRKILNRLINSEGSPGSSAAEDSDEEEFVRFFNHSIVVNAYPEQQDLVLEFLGELGLLLDGQTEGIVTPGELAVRRQMAYRARVEEVLDQPWEADFTDVPLSDVLELYSNKKGIDIRIDPRVIPDVDVEELITLQVKPDLIPGRTLLYEFLLSPGDLVYQIRDGYLSITTYTEQFDTAYKAHVYDCADLWSDSTSPQKIRNTLVKIIQDMIRIPDLPYDTSPWVEDPHWVETYRGCLIVYGIPEDHEQVKDLLKKLRDSRKK